MVLIAPSLISADQTRIAETIRQLEDAGAELIHIDAMDGLFVPNVGYGPKFVADLRRITELQLDVHMMFYNPLRYVGMYARAGANMISVHAESLDEFTAAKFIELGTQAGFRKGFALKPSTKPPDWLRGLLPKVDFLVPMTVEPGFSGQRFIASGVDNMRYFHELRRQQVLDIRLEADGGVTPEVADILINSGADILVSGSFVFQSPNVTQALRRLRGEKIEP